MCHRWGFIDYKRKGDNKDLSNVMQHLLDHRGQSIYLFFKVRGHAKDIHVSAGLNGPIDNDVGNGAAEIFAVKGAEACLSGIYFETLW